MAEKLINTIIQVRRDTQANWTNVASEFVPKEGEPCLTLDGADKGKVKYGDGVTTWGALEYSGGDIPVTQVFQVTANTDETDEAAIARITAGKTIIAGDVVIVSRVISGEKVSKTAYNYNGTAWTALDGNYNAKNVYFDKNLTFTVPFGKYNVPASGMGTISSDGVNVYDFFNSALNEEKNPSTTQPAVTLNSSEVKSYEVGTSVAPKYSASLSKGSYTYGPDTGITAATWSVVFNSETLTTASGTFSAVTVEDNTSLSITATATYEAGAMPKTNIGNDYPAGQIKAGSASKTSGNITGYRNSFYGTFADKTTALSSNSIRGLTASNKALSNGSTFSITLPVGTQSVVFAYPATLRDVTSVKDVNGLNAEIKGAFTKSVVQVEGANAYTAKDYKVYRTDFAEALGKANTYTVTI